jgi:hydrogenase expression/formation protein HypC
MCLAVPGKVVRWLDRSEPFARAEVEFDGVRREVGMAFTPEAREGEYVIVHAGVAISVLAAAEAESLLATLKELVSPPISHQGER